MKVSLTHHIEAMQGTYKTTDLVYRTSGKTGKVYASSKIRPANPRTPDQQATRRIQAMAVRHWCQLTREQRSAWDQFAGLFASGEAPRSGQAVCREAARMRLLLGLEPRCEAPQFGFPLRVSALVLDPSADSRAFVFQVTHAMDALAGYVVLMKITPPSPTDARAPVPLQARSICGLGPQSAAPLPPSGGTVSFTDTRFAIEPGQRFGATATIVRLQDGLASPPVFFDLLR
jgi:hypothetical protein